MKSIQIDLSCAGENECDRGGGGGSEAIDRQGAERKGQKTTSRSIWARRGGMIYSKLADIPPPFSSTCFLKRSEKLETA